MKMIRAKRSVVLVRRWLMRARQDLELVPAVYLLIRFVVESYAVKRSGAFARGKCPLGTTGSVAHRSADSLARDHVKSRSLKATIVKTVDADLFHGSPVLARPIPPATPLPFLQYIRTMRDNAIAVFTKTSFTNRSLRSNISSSTPSSSTILQVSSMC